jgi:hydroxymethylbilane synthase
MAQVLRLGTRGSPLALAQAAEVKARLAAAHPALASPEAIAIVPIRTSGDRSTLGPLGDAGVKGLFTKEIDQALADGTIDAAVHSLKDLPSEATPGVAIACHLPRADPRDALIARHAASLAALPAGAAIGTASVRRRAQILHARADLVVVPLRGNVGTRLAKLEAGAVAATVLAVAGLQRLGRMDAITTVLPPETMLPAAGQGVIVVETRADDTRTRTLLAALDDAATAACATAERALLATLDGSCRTPIAALATLAGATLTLDAMVIRPDGGAVHRTQQRGAAATAHALGTTAGAELAARAGAGFFATGVPG